MVMILPVPALLRIGESELAAGAVYAIRAPQKMAEARNVGA
jgi:hypothetical protein